MSAQRHGLDTAVYPLARMTVNAANALAGVEAGQINGRSRMSTIYVIAFRTGMAGSAKTVVVF